MLNRNREGWRNIADELSAYYNTPGRLAVFRRWFENAHRLPGPDPATFATELGILALHGFSDMKEKARDLMVRDKFITSQQSCDLRRHLDGATPETSILDIADSCRIWESQGEPTDREDGGQNLKCRQRISPMPSLTKRNSGPGVGGPEPATNSPPWRADHSMADKELLIRTVLEVVRERRETVMKDQRDRNQCFSCGFLRHGVTRCIRLDRSFSYIKPGWSVNLRDGKYRASKLTEDGHISARGKEGWFGREGQFPRPSATITRLTQVGVVVCLGNNRNMTPTDPDGLRMCRASQFWGALFRQKRTAVIVQYRVVQRWWIKIQNWTLSVAHQLDLRTGHLWADGWSTLQLHQQRLTPG